MISTTPRTAAPPINEAIAIPPTDPTAHILNSVLPNPLYIAVSANYLVNVVIPNRPPVVPTRTAALSIS